jgi:hypothetical protein
LAPRLSPREQVAVDRALDGGAVGWLRVDQDARRPALRLSVEHSGPDTETAWRPLATLHALDSRVWRGQTFQKLGYVVASITRRLAARVSPPRRNPDDAPPPVKITARAAEELYYRGLTLEDVLEEHDAVLLDALAEQGARLYVNCAGRKSCKRVSVTLTLPQPHGPAARPLFDRLEHRRWAVTLGQDVSWIANKLVAIRAKQRRGPAPRRNPGATNAHQPRALPYDAVSIDPAALALLGRHGRDPVDLLSTRERQLLAEALRYGGEHRVWSAQSNDGDQGVVLYVAFPSLALESVDDRRHARLLVREFGKAGWNAYEESLVASRFAPVP